MFARDPLANPEPLIRRVYAYVAYRIGDGPDAEDVTSETFERALRYRDSYRSSKGEPVGWLIGIARRCIADAVKGRLELAEPRETAAPDDVEADSIRRLDLAQTMAGLDERDRELLALRYGADLTARRSASCSGCARTPSRSRSTARSAACGSNSQGRRRIARTQTRARPPHARRQAESWRRGGALLDATTGHWRACPGGFPAAGRDSAKAAISSSGEN